MQPCITLVCGYTGNYTKMALKCLQPAIMSKHRVNKTQAKGIYYTNIGGARSAENLDAELYGILSAWSFIRMIDTTLSLHHLFNAA